MFTVPMFTVVEVKNSGGTPEPQSGVMSLCGSVTDESRTRFRSSRSSEGRAVSHPFQGCSRVC